MPEYRYIGVSVTGKPIQGVVFSPDEKTVKAKISKLVKSRGVRIDAIQKKSTFLYKVAQRGIEKPIKGEQRAFSKQDLEAALAKMGYRVIYVRKKLISLRLRIGTKDLVMFIRICADLLKERFPYDEILTLVSSDTTNRTLRETIQDIQRDLKSGLEGAAVYEKHADVLGTFTAHMLGVASTSGNMAEIYESTAKFLEREEEFKSNLRSILVMPAVVLIAMFGAMGFYVMYIFPKITTLLVKYDIEIPPMTKATMQFSQFVQDYFLILAILIAAPLVYLFYALKTENGRYVFDRTLISIPLIGPVIHRTSIEIFARVFSALYSSSGENVTAIRIAAESCRNKFIEKQITGMVIPAMLKEGRSFVECLSRTNCFTLTAVRRFKSGEESGTLKQSALQLAQYYENETKHKMKSLVDWINIIISLIITVLIIAITLVSSEIGFVSPPSPLTK